MAQPSSPARTAAAVLLFAVIGALLPTHALVGGGTAGPTRVGMHAGVTLVKATAITAVRVAADKTPAPAGYLPTALLLGAVLVAVATGTVAARGHHGVRIVAAPSRAPPVPA